MVLQKTLGLAKFWSNFTGGSRSLVFNTKLSWSLEFSQGYVSRSPDSSLYPSLFIYVFLHHLIFNFSMRQPTNFRENVNPKSVF